MLTYREGISLNEKCVPFDYEPPAVKHEGEFCPVCPGGKCTWTKAMPQWREDVITARFVRSVRKYELGQEYKAAKAEYRDPMHLKARIGSYFLNADPMPTVIFGLKTKVRKGINAADAKFQAQQHQQFLHTVHTVNLTVDTGMESFVEEDEFFSKQEAVITASAIEVVQVAAGKALKANGYKLTPKQAKRLRKNSNKGKASKPRNTSKCRKSTRKVIKLVTTLLDIHRENLRQVKLTARHDLRTFRTNTLRLIRWVGFVDTLDVSFDASTPWMNYLEG